MCFGGSVATNGLITGKVVEVQDLDMLARLGKKQLEGKVVFFNKAFDERLLNTFSAYGKAVEVRWAGAMEAAKYGAIAVLVRSMTGNLDDYPHTGSMGYDSSVQKIPAFAISTLAAEALQRTLLSDVQSMVSLESDCRTLPDVQSYNVIGEIRGSMREKGILLAGGHLDSWDMGEGAHDDGAGCVQAIEAVRLFKLCGYAPKHTIRAVLFMNEENGLRGGKMYAEQADKEPCPHRYAIESDRGGFVPQGFSFDVRSAAEMAVFQGIKESFVPYHTDYFSIGGGGADIAPLKSTGTVCIGLLPDSQRYFVHHHAATDVLESVNARELSMGAASMAAMLYLLDHVP